MTPLRVIAMDRVGIEKKKPFRVIESMDRIGVKGKNRISIEGEHPVPFG